MTAADYQFTLFPSVAWAYLRRNENYQKETSEYLIGPCKEGESSGFPCFQQVQTDLKAQNWGLLCYEDPQNCRSPFWHPEVNNHTLSAEVLSAEDRKDAHPFISMLQKAGASIRGLRLLDGQLCLTVTSSENVTQLMFPPGTALAENSFVMLILPFELNLPIRAEKAKILWDFSNGKAKNVYPRSDNIVIF